MFKTIDSGKTWAELSGLRSAKGHLWQPGAGGMGLHTIGVVTPHFKKNAKNGSILMTWWPAKAAKKLASSA